MFAALYGNIGGKIKGLAFGTFFFEAISSIISGFSMLVADEGYFEALFWSGLALLFFGPIAAFVSSWILYGFGELVENSTTNKDTITEMNIRLMKIESHCKGSNANAPKEKPGAPNEKSNTSSAANATEQTDKPTESKAHEKAEQAEAIPVGDNTIACSNCGFKQNSWRKICFHCGTPLKGFSEQYKDAQK